MATQECDHGRATVAVPRAAVGAALALAVVFSVGPDSLTNPLANLATTAAASWAAWSCWWSGGAAPPAAMRSWRLFALACAAWAAGTIGWAWYDLVLEEPVPVPSPLDPIYLTFFPFAIAAMLAWPSRPRTRDGRLRDLFDALTFMASMAFIMWAVVGIPVAGEGTLNGGALVALLAYPVGDSFICGLVLSRLWSNDDVHTAFTMATLGIVAVSLADATWAYLMAHGRYRAGIPLDAVYVLGFLLLAHAARLGPVTIGVSHRTQRARRPLRMVILGLPMGIIVLAQSQPHLDPTLARIGAIAVGCLVVAQTFAKRDAEALNDALVSATAEAAHQASHDPVTGLPNRRALNSTLVRTPALFEADGRGGDESSVAVLFIDLDDFKSVNQRHGHEVGDLVLAATAARVRSVLREGDVAARFGGDEIMVICRRVRSADEALAIAEQISSAFRTPVTTTSGRRVRVTVCIGVAVGEPTELATLVHHADDALVMAKKGGRDRIQLATTELLGSKERRRAVEEALTGAVEDGRLSFQIQPIFDTEGALVAGEALVRLVDGNGVSLSPEEFIAVAEDTGQIKELGQHVLWSACQDAARWEDANVAVSVNVSAHQLTKGFVEDVVTCLGMADLEPARLWIEITESSLVFDIEGATARLAVLHDAGIRIAVDDFGTGYAMLSYLRELPVDIVKIDRTLVQAVTSPDGRAMVEATIAMAHASGLLLVAEGIETEAQAVLLTEAGCDLLQGFGLARPMPRAAFAARCRMRPEGRGARLGRSAMPSGTASRNQPSR